MRTALHMLNSSFIGRNEYERYTSHTMEFIIQLPKADEEFTIGFIERHAYERCAERNLFLSCVLPYRARWVWAHISRPSKMGRTIGWGGVRVHALSILLAHIWDEISKKKKIIILLYGPTHGPMGAGSMCARALPQCGKHFSIPALDPICYNPMAHQVLAFY